MEISKHDIGINANFSHIVNRNYGHSSLEDVVRGVAISSKQQRSAIEDNSSISGFLTPNRVVEEQKLQKVKMRDPIKIQKVNLGLESPNIE